ncbi:hypothetical protein [Pseudomonas sp. MN1F]|uniref:hypothetical protein n=1 Tax=Pseudomonas sp. MN1F TaxID=1366632 RepID=UPI00128FB64A|nr:hypothetical protein [Pseudomonas sp. MN1F]MQG92602.1 hypothetical protein [Pseudomonas sp. MN1F]
MPIVSFVVNQNRLTKSHVEIDAVAVNPKVVAFVAEFAMVFEIKPHPGAADASGQGRYLP